MRNQPSFLHEVYDFRGTPYEIGYQRGKLTADYVKKNVEKLSVGNPYYGATPTPEQYNLDYLKANYPNQFKKWEATLAKAPEWLHEEARGLAEGAGVPLEKVLIMGDMIPFFLRSEIEAGQKAILDGDCNGFVAYGDATVGGRVLVGGNSEGSHAGIRYLSVIRVKNKVGNSYVQQSHFNRGLGVGQAGMNEKGVCIFGSGVSVKHEFWGDVGYRIMIRRKVLQDADNVDDAIDIFKEGPLMGGQHMYIGDTKRAVHIEHTGRDVEVIDPECGFDAGSSPYFSSPRMQQFCDVMVDETDPEFTFHFAKKRGVFRMERYHELFQMKKPLKLEDLPSMTGDHGGRGTGLVQEHIEGACPQGSDYTICAHGTAGHGSEGPQGQSGSFHANAWSVIHVPDQRKMYMAFGNPCEAGYVPFYPPK
jgi:hypothetical protein